MYIEELHYINVGPIERIDLRLLNDSEENPKPIVFVGKNGSGKSHVLSNIVDALYEIADIAYTNATETSEKNGHQYFRAIMPSQIRLGQTSMFAHIKFRQGTERIEYLEKSGNCSRAEYLERYHNQISEKFNWNDNENYKEVDVQKVVVKTAFEQNIVCYFAPDRYMKPDWMGDKYYVVKTEEEGTFSHRVKYTDHLRNPIRVPNSAETILQWLFDLIADAMFETEDNITVSQLRNGGVLPDTVAQRILTHDGRAKVEKIMSTILDEDIIFRMGVRTSGLSRLRINSAKEKRVVVVLCKMSDMTIDHFAKVALPWLILLTGIVVVLVLFPGLITWLPSVLLG